MDTNKLIRALSADAGRRSRLTSVSWLAVAAATVMAATIFLMLIGPRADIAEAAKSVRFLFKFVVTLTLVATAIFLVVRMSRPGASLTAPLSLLGLVPVLLVGAIGLEFLTVPADQWSQRWIGSNSMVCLTFIPLIGVAPLAVFLAAMRYGAPTRLGLAGAGAGLLAGGLAATFYAAHCIDDSPFFLATWYPIAIAVLVVIGFIAGRTFLRW
jgi:hypothetical protein